ncbi:MAG: methyltransferase domain-containing protein [Proteobacteria bacterium]|nr:methyltransferase domain-containing protein [Pseudomonadota bacterium]
MADWDKKYRNGYYDGATEPHDLLQKFWQVIPGKKVIDVAMGNGRDSIFLAKKGFCVYGLEKSMEAIRIAKKTTESAGHPISIIRGDAATMPFKDNSADCVIVFYFLLRDIMRDIPDMLRKGGILIYETFLKRQNEVEVYTANTASERGRLHGLMPRERATPLRGQAQAPEIDGRRNPDYLLEDGELISYFRDFQLLFYEETIAAFMNNRRAAAKFIGRKR